MWLSKWIRIRGVGGMQQGTVHACVTHDLPLAVIRRASPTCFRAVFAKHQVRPGSFPSKPCPSSSSRLSQCFWSWQRQAGSTRGGWPWHHENAVPENQSIASCRCRCPKKLNEIIITERASFPRGMGGALYEEARAKTLIR